MSITEAIKKFNGASTWKSVALIEIRENDVDILRYFINSIFWTRKSNYATHMRRLICFYDWKRYGLYDSI